MSDVIHTLEQRGFVGQLTEPQLGRILSENTVTLYAGFDPSAPSLHIGNLLVIMGLAWFQRHGHRPIALIGGGTGMIGDPSGKTVERQLLSLEDIERNLAGIRGQLARFLDFDSGKNGALMLNNADWLRPLNFIEFLRDIGKRFRLGEMLAKESVKLRLASEAGISFTEFCYMLLQAYDFLYLFDHHQCQLQIGGSDQWGNITAGIELIRKVHNRPAYGLTFPLLTTATGQKFGKTEAGTIWLDPELTRPYDFYQFWVRSDDRDVIRLLKLFTFLSLEEIADLEEQLRARPEQRIPHKRLAYEVTSLVHGKDAADKAQAAAEKLFGLGAAKSAVDADMPQTILPYARIARGLNILEALVESGLCKSKSEARRLVSQGGAYVNGERISDIEHVLSEESLNAEKTLLLKTGKKNYHLLKFA